MKALIERPFAAALFFNREWLASFKRKETCRIFFAAVVFLAFLVTFLAAFFFDISKPSSVNE